MGTLGDLRGGEAVGSGDGSNHMRGALLSAASAPSPPTSPTSSGGALAVLSGSGTPAPPVLREEGLGPLARPCVGPPQPEWDCCCSTRGPRRHGRAACSCWQRYLLRMPTVVDVNNSEMPSVPPLDPSVSLARRCCPCWLTTAMCKTELREGCLPRCCP
ncbi:shadow of prion protein isoform X1 [Perognathus longimembris pacificus]|uniref:shadow of prion protein isoform X1 n=1 Tax=Perognathus longimembris pacificus TaxID=214514 RepID=UPI002018C5B9|nr:shadow of prion protein isoform X1 [Perognathus longimembris pacificus]